MVLTLSRKPSDLPILGFNQWFWICLLEVLLTQVELMDDDILAC